MSALTAYTANLTAPEAIFARALERGSSRDVARRFTGHMLMEMARMSIEGWDAAPEGLIPQSQCHAFRRVRR